MAEISTSLDSFVIELEKNGIEIIEHKCTRNLDGQKCRTCILGVLLSENGMKIEHYMLSWLTKAYNVFSVRQPVPGALFEYPALRFAQLVSIERDEPVLYLHTKGAANQYPFQRKTVNMWKHEFVRSKKAYEANLDSFDILLPYSGPQVITWFNGFIATKKAFSSISPIPVFENRFYYEILFKNSSLRCFGRRYTNIVKTEQEDTTRLMYRDIKRFSASFFSISEFLKKHLASHH